MGQRLELIGVLLSQALDDEVGVIAAWPLEELVVPAARGPMFIGRRSGT